MGLGLVLIGIILLVNVAAWAVRQMGGRFEHRP
jgi:hypothetical protein